MATLFAIVCVMVGLQIESKLRLFLIALGAIALAFTLYFFRDPRRTVPVHPDADRMILAPADGKVVEIVAAQKDQEKARLVAEQEANQRTVAARAEAEVAERQAQAIRHTAKGEADAVRERATGQADALRIEAEGYGHNVTIRADAEQKASEAQASARIRLADAIQKEGEARAGAEAKLIEARNQVSDKVMLFQALMSAIEKSPSILSLIHI